MITELKYVISTHARYEDVTLPRLLQSLIETAGIPAKRLLVVSGGHSKTYERTRNGVRFRYVRHNSFDHTGLIDILERGRRTDYWFALHDTCEAGPRFYELSRNFKPALEHVSTNTDGWHNMGLFSWGFLQREADYILSLKNCDKVRAMYSERVYVRLAQSGCYGQGKLDFLGFSDVYHTGTQRSTLYMPDLDLYKYQANWQALEAPFVEVP